jgi:hypothetical protein
MSDRARRQRYCSRALGPIAIVPPVSEPTARSDDVAIAVFEVITNMSTVKARGRPSRVRAETPAKKSHAPMAAPRRRGMRWSICDRRFWPARGRHTPYCPMHPNRSPARGDQSARTDKTSITNMLDAPAAFVLARSACAPRVDAPGPCGYGRDGPPRRMAPTSALSLGSHATRRLTAAVSSRQQIRPSVTRTDDLELDTEVDGFVSSPRERCRRRTASTNTLRRVPWRATRSRTSASARRSRRRLRLAGHRVSVREHGSAVLARCLRPLGDDEIAATAPSRLPPRRSPMSTGLRVRRAAMLQSPHFLYRAELERATHRPSRRLPFPYELASRLSFFWNTTPDDEPPARRPTARPHRRGPHRSKRLGSPAESARGREKFCRCSSSDD